MGLTILGIIFIVTSLGQLRVVANNEWYAYCVNYLPPALITIRHLLSWAQRIIGLCIGVGLIVRHRWSATLAIYLSIFEIVFVYWKFPYEAFKNQGIVLDQHYGWILRQFGFQELHFASFPKETMILFYIVHLAFFSFVIYYLTRPHIKRRFIKESSSC